MESVLVVRQFDRFSQILIKEGFPVTNCPTIETVESENLDGLSAKISARNYDGIFLTSRKATEIVCGRVFGRDFNFDGRIYVLGKSSFERLKDENLDLFFDEKANTARELLAAIPPAELKGKRFLFIRGENSLGVIKDFMRDVALLDEEIVYRTRRVEVDATFKAELSDNARDGAFPCACFFSPSGAESFLAQLGTQLLRESKIAAIGKTTADFLETRDLKADFVSTKATAEDFAVELMDYLISSDFRVPISGSD